MQEWLPCSSTLEPSTHAYKELGASAVALFFLKHLTIGMFDHFNT